VARYKPAEGVVFFKVTDDRVVRTLQRRWKRSRLAVG